MVTLFLVSNPTSGELTLPAPAAPLQVEVFWATPECTHFSSWHDIRPASVLTVVTLAELFADSQRHDLYLALVTESGEVIDPRLEAEEYPGASVVNGKLHYPANLHHGLYVVPHPGMLDAAYHYGAPGFAGQVRQTVAGRALEAVRHFLDRFRPLPHAA